MRLKDTQEQLTYLKHAAAQGHMEHVFAGLDVLGATPWRVNRAVFDVVLAVWNSGKPFLKIPGEVFEEPEPVRPEDWRENVKAKSEWMREVREWTARKAGSHSNRCGVNYKVEIARAVSLPSNHRVSKKGRKGRREADNMWVIFSDSSWRTRCTSRTTSTSAGARTRSRRT